MAREKVEFSPNIPTQVILASPGVAQANGEGAAEFRYFLQGEKIMWVPPQIHAAIIGATRGDPTGHAFNIVKSKNGNRPATWSIEPATTSQSQRNALDPPTPAQQPAGPHTWAPAAGGGEIELQAADRLAAAYAAAIDVAMQAQEYGRRKGMALAFTAPDIRAIAATLYIGGKA